MDSIKEILEKYPLLTDFLKFLAVLILETVSYLITKKILIKAVSGVVKKTKTHIDDILLNEKLLSRISYVIPLIIIYQFLYLVPNLSEIIENILESLIVLILLIVLINIIDAANELYEKSKLYNRKPIKGYLQIVKIIIDILGGIVIIGLLTGQQPWTILTGVGALTAVLLLVFKDTILSFVASLHISAYDLVRVGDWIEVPKFGADGDVSDIALHTIKVQNFDKTIVVIPTYKLIDSGFKNCRGMQLAGGRRIKRSVYIDLSSVKFVDDRMMQKYKRFELLKDYLEQKEKEIEEYNKTHHVDTSELINGRRLTNIGTFRAYLKEYLKHRKDINKGFTFLVRQLTPEPNEIPIEIYVFANTTLWTQYEEIQADIFDHIFAVITEFELSIFQNPTGKDFKELAKPLNN